MGFSIWTNLFQILSIMALELKAKLIQINPVQSGQTRTGNTWKKQEIIVETVKTQYPKKVCLTIWGDKIDQFNYQQGNEYTFSLDIESREYNGRWYTDVKAYEIKAEEGQPVMSKTDEEWNAKATAIKNNAIPDFDTDDDDLPF